MFADCFNYIGPRNSGGYGLFRKKLAHRIVYAFVHGCIPQGLVIDHICRNRACVNPKHLRAVTRRVNALENNGSPFAINARQTHCPKGHPYNAKNTSRASGKGRRCLKCARLYMRERNKRLSVLKDTT